MTRWGIGWGRLWNVLLFTVLGFFWLIWLQVFCEKMLPRLAYLAGRPIANDPPCITPECDFSVFWPAGLLARAGDFATLYHPSTFLAFQRHVLLPAAGFNAFIYPPFMLPAASLISHLPFEPAFFVWTASLLLLAGWVLRQAGFSWTVIAAGLLSPASLWTLELGQVEILGAGLLLAGLSRARVAPWRAGLLLGLLAAKPQAGLMVPAALLGRCNGRALAGFALTCAGLGAVVAWWFGPQSWLGFLQAGRQGASLVMQGAFAPALSPGNGVAVFWMLRSLGCGPQAAWAGQGAAAMIAMAGCWYLWRRQGDDVPRAVALTALLGLLATPYGYTDDMVAGAIALAALAQQRGWRLYATDVLFWLWPAFCQIVALRTGILFTPLVVLAALARIALPAARPVLPAPAQE